MLLNLDSSLFKVGNVDNEGKDVLVQGNYRDGNGEMEGTVRQGTGTM